MSYEPIAIVGRAVVLPGALSPGALWRLVRAKQSAITAVPDGRFGLDPDLVRGTPSAWIDKTWSTMGGYVDEAAAELALGDYPGCADVRGLDPLFGWVVGTAHQALLDAGLGALNGARAARAGVVFGNLSFPTAAMVRLGEGLALSSTWRQAADRRLGDHRDRHMSGLPARLAGQHLGLRAFAYALDAACASSLYAVHLGARALQRGEVDVVVAGAVNRSDSLFLHVGFTALQALSQRGLPRPFDEDADGLVPAEGAGAVTLMRLSDAEREGRTIHGVICGSALSNDGRQKSLLAPSSEGQARAVANAWRQAGREPRTAQLFECHATGTQTGDKTELETLARVLDVDGERAVAPQALSSLKSNLGHLITAAGVAGLIKTTEAMAAAELPPSINVARPIEAARSQRFAVQTEVAPWHADGARRAGVSAFGFGGNNAHVVVEQYARGVHVVPAVPGAATPSAAAPLAAAPRALAVVACAARSGDVRGGAEVLLRAPGRASDVVIDTVGLKVQPNDLKASIGQQTLMLETARDVVLHLGDQAVRALPPLRTGVFVGMGADLQVTTPGLRFRAAHLAARAAGGSTHHAVVADVEIARLRDLAMPPMTAAHVLGLMPNIPANRLSVQLDLRGAGFTVSSEARSGVDALAVAYALIEADELDAAIVGAVEAGADARQEEALGLPAGAGADAAVALVVMAETRAAELGLAPIAIVELDDAAHASADLSPVVDARAHLGAGLTAAAGLLGVAEGIAAAGAAAVTVVVDEDDAPGGARARVRPAKGAARCADVALVFGPVSQDVPTLTAPFLALAPVRAALAAQFGDALDGMAAAQVGAAGCERDLFVGAVHMLARAAFVSEVCGVDVGHHVGISLGESASLVHAGVWRDPRALLEDTVASRLFTDMVAGRREAVSAFWAARGQDELDASWATAVVRAPRAALEAAVAQIADVWITMWHTDDEAELAGAPDAVVAAAAAVSATPTLLKDAPAVHGPVVAAAAARYRALHHRAAHAPARTARLWSCGVAERGGLLTPNAAACADAILTQAGRTVDVPAVLRAAWDAGARTFIDVSPRGLVAAWCRRALPDARVIAVGDDVLAAARSLAHLTSERRFMTSHIDEPKAAVRVPAHTPPQPWPLPQAAARAPEAMTPPPARPRLLTTPSSRRAPSLTPRSPSLAPAATPSRAAPSPMAPSPSPAALSSAAPAVAPHAVGSVAPVIATPALTELVASAPASDGVDDAVRRALLAQRQALAAVHQSFVQTATAAHTAFLASRARLMQGALAFDPSTSAPVLAPAPPAAPVAAPITSTTSASVAAPMPFTATTAAPPTPAAAPALSATAAPAAPQRVLFDRAQLEALASDKISTVLGPLFARQDRFPRQVRMPEPPLLLCDRVLSTTCTPGVLDKGKQMFTVADVRSDAWYLHDGRIPAGIMIETGQADLLLISMMGVDFENQGARVYRLLGCDLTYTDALPLAGQMLHHAITIDGHATAAISAASEARIFFFHSDTRLGDEHGPVVLQVRNGQAGFFTDDELLNSGGVLWKPADEDALAIAKLPHEPAPRPTTKKALSRDELVAWATGHAFACFGAGFELTQTHVRTARIEAPHDGNDPFGNPDGRAIDLTLMDRVTALDVTGGPWGRGYVRAELDLHKDKWFYAGHFKDDPCMPGTVMFQGCLQVAATLLAARGHIIDTDGFRFEPKHGQQMRLRCRGQATPTSSHMVYELFCKGVVTVGQQVELRCDILVTVDGLKSLHCQDVVLALVTDFPMLAEPKLLGVATKADGRDAVAPRSVTAPTAAHAVTGFRSLMSTGIGRPGAAFPGLYDVYDDGSPVARMPGPPYHFMSNVDEVSGPPMGSLAAGKSPTGTKASVRYDVPDDAWYFAASDAGQGGKMPFAVLLEVALQPCGWLSSYVGSTRTSQAPLKYRNLDGKATQHREVGRDVGALITRAELLKSSSSGGMIIQDFRFEVTTQVGEPVFSGTTVFGFFPDAALERQVGVGSTDDEKARLRAPSALPGFPRAFDDEGTWRALAPSKLTLPSLSSNGPGTPPLLMIDRVEGAWRTPGGHLRVRTAKDVVLDDWFFKAHFFRDPVQPGSLGIEAMVQALMFSAAFDDVGAHLRAPRFEALALGTPLTWKYRGQVVPRNALIQVETEVTRIERAADGSVTVVGDGALWVDGLRIYLAKDLAVRVVEG